MNIQQILTRVGKEIHRHAPTIMSTLAVAGIGVTAYLSAKAGYKSAEQIVDHEITTGETIRDPKLKLELVWRNYIAPTSVGLTTAALVISSNTISVKRQTALLGAYALSERAIAAYREKMIEHLGPEKALTARQEIVKENAAATSAKELEADISDGQSLFLDQLSGQYFVSDVETIRKAMNDTNQKCINEGYASMNYFYSLIGARRTQLGEVIGWNTWRMLEVELIEGLTTEDGQMCTGLDYKEQPTMEYYRVE